MEPGHTLTHIENNILRLVCLQDIADILWSPELLDDPEPLTAQCHISWDVPTACRNPICVESFMKLRVKDPAKVLKGWIWIRFQIRL